MIKIEISEDKFFALIKEGIGLSENQCILPDFSKCTELIKIDYPFDGLDILSNLVHNLTI